MVPATPLPSGFHSSISKFELPLDKFSTLAFRSTGHWSKGTVLFAVEERAGEPPGYSEARREKEEGEGGVCEVVVEARWNSEALWAESRVEVIAGETECGIAITTPPGSSRSRLAAALSFHLTFTLPALASLEGLIVSSPRFRILFAPSFTLPLTTLSLSTTDAPIQPSVPLHAASISLSNKNDLDPDRTRLKNFEDSIHGSFVASHLLSIDTQNAAVSGGPYVCTSGPLTVRSSNFALLGDFSSGGPMRISTSNASITGTFASEDLMELATSYGKIKGTFRSPKGIELATTRAAINGEFSVGRKLKLVTSSFRIDAKVNLLPPASSVVLRTPTPSVVEGVSPPTWEDVLREETERDREVVVDIETTDAAIEVVYLSHPASVRLLSKVRSSGGSRVAVTHPADYEGSFSASTTITSTAHLDAPAPPSGLADPGPSRGRRVVDYSSKKRSEVAGTVHYEGGSSSREDRSLSRSEVRAVSGPAEIVLE